MERKLGTETLDKVEDWFSNTWYGEKFLESQEREKELEQQLIDRGGLGGWITEQRNTPNQTEQNILKGISDFTKVDERITTPATYLTIGALGGKLSKVQGSKAASFKRGHKLKKTLEKSKTKRTNVGQPARLQTIDVNAQAIDSVFNMPPAEFQKIIRLARQEGINSLTLARRFNQQQGIIKTYLDSKGKTDLTEGAKDLKGMSQEPKVSTNEHIKRALINDQNIILSPTYKGGQITRRDHADFFDVSAALIGGGQEDARDPSGRKIDYNRAKVTEFGGTKSEKRDLVYNHINSKIKGGISREEFNEYAKEQIAAEKDLRKAIKLLNVRAYASMKGIDLSEYPTKESQLELLSEINKAKKNKTGHLDYKETFDYGHIISAKTGFRLEDLGMNRISNTEIEAAHNIVSRDPYTQKIIEILQEGNRERGSRRDYHPTIQRMRNTAGSVVEDFIKWKANKGDDSVNLTKILEKFIPKDQHENYLQFIQKRFYEKRALGYATKKEFVEEVYGFPYKLYKDMPNKQKHEIDKAYVKQRSESGIVAGKQQYD